MVSLLLALGLALAPVPARAAGASSDTVKLVEAFLETPTAELPADLIPEFLAVDPNGLPPKLRVPYMGKRLELYSLKQIVEGKKRGGVRMPEENCAVVQEAKSDSAGVVKAAGYEPITDTEEVWLMKQTQCSERDMMCEFTLQVIVAKSKKGGYAQRFLFLHPKDPLFAMVGQYRAMGRTRQTNFFGIGGMVCAPHH